MRIIISGGGTGGHIYPAIAIANALKEVHPGVEILFVGARGKLEMEKVPKAGYEIKGLWISGLHRKLTLRNLMFPIKLISSLLKAGGIIRKFKPNAVVGVGGYASGPVLQIASSRKIPSLIQEQNSYAGITNKLLAKKVDKVCVAYPKMEKYFPADKLVFTGNPVRKDIANLKDKYKDAIGHYGLRQNKKTLLIFGGSLGARTLNEAVRENAELIKANPDCQWIWQTGKLYYDAFSQLDVAQYENVRVYPFLERMDLAYAAADLVICRAGALTVSELCIAAKPAILVPSPNVAEDHQTKNAMALVERNAAEIIKDKVAKDELIKKAIELVHNQDKLEELSTAIHQLAKPNAAAAIANEIWKLLERGT